MEVAPPYKLLTPTSLLTYKPYMYNPTCIVLYGSAVYLIMKIVRAVSPGFRSLRKTLSNNFVIVIYTIYLCSLKKGFVSVALE